MKTKGFTLVELLVVIAILAILATVSVVGYTSYISSTEEKAALTEANEIKSAIENALVLDKNVELVVGSQTLVFTRTATGITVAAKANTDTTNYTDLVGIPAELVAKLTFADGTLTYSYDTAGTYTHTIIAK